MAVILASQSPRRRELLTKIGLSFTVVTADIDETMDPAKPPREEVARLSRDKARAVWGRGHEDDVIIAADTIVVIDGQVLGKPTDKQDAARMLRLLSGREHQVMTGLTVLYRDKAVTHDYIDNKDCIKLMLAKLKEEGIMTDEKYEAMRAEIAAELDDAVAYAQAAPKATAEDLYANIYAD